MNRTPGAVVSASSSPSSGWAGLVPAVLQRRDLDLEGIRLTVSTTAPQRSHLRWDPGMTSLTRRPSVARTERFVSRVKAR